MDARRFAEDCAAYLADRNAEEALEQHRNTPAPSSELFLSLLHHDPPRSSAVRAGLFELWLRAEPRPKGGAISGANMDNELPVLHWLLRKQVAEVFQGLIGTHRDGLHDFVSWFLAQARAYTKYFNGKYKYSSFIVYAFGRPRFAAWAQPAQEVQDAATSLGISFPEGVRLPAMPRLEEPTCAVSVISPVRISGRRLKRIQDQLFGPDSGESE